MTYHVYVNSGGFADISELPLDADVFPDHQYLGAFDAKPDVDGKRYVDGHWVRGSSEPEYIGKRKKAYPVGDLLDALWHAMDDGTLPKVPGFYDRVKDIKDRIPKG